MSHPYRYGLIVGVAAVIWAASCPLFSAAQDRQEGTVRSTSTVTNLFETVDPGRAVEALRVTVPDEWILRDVRLLRYGTEPVSVEVQRTDREGEHLVTVSRPIRGPHDLVVRARTPELPGTGEWSVRTLVRRGPQRDSATQSRFRVADRRTHRVAVEAPSPSDRTNRALSLAEAKEPLRIRAGTLPPLGQASAFTIEFWVQTNELDDVILSTWNGRESASYPAEFVIDRGGRLRFYNGRPGRHRALQTGRPVADGGWHHVAGVYDADRSRLRLFLDGRMVDSLRGQVPLASEAGPLAVGGRLGRDPRPEAHDRPLFSGQIDELRIWGEARSAEGVRRMKSRPLRGAGDEKEKPRLVRLGFDGEDGAGERDGVIEQWPEGARRVPATLSFRSGLRRLRARTEGRTVTLKWVAQASDIEHFVVERATGGRGFTGVAALTPAEAKRSSVSDVPEFSYTDEQVSGHVVFYRIRLERADGTKRTSGTIKIGLGPESRRERPVKLIGNFPNPFSETTTIAYEVNTSKLVTITVWDLQGQKIAQLADGPKDTGYHEVSFDATDLPSGNYFVRLETPTGEQSHKMVVLK